MASVINLQNPLSCVLNMSIERRVREAAADQAVGEIVVVTHAAPHPDGLVFTGDSFRNDRF